MGADETPKFGGLDAERFYQDEWKDWQERLRAREEAPPLPTFGPATRPKITRVQMYPLAQYPGRHRVEITTDGEPAYAFFVDCDRDSADVLYGAISELLENQR